MELIESKQRCSTCFNPKPEGRFCFECHRSDNPFLALGAAFEYEGPVASLVRYFKYGRLDYLASSLAAYLVAQLIQLGWAFPDVIIPVPMSAPHFFVRGFNQSDLLAKSVGALIQRPVMQALGRYAGDYSQAGLTREQRAALGKSNIILLSKEQLRNQKILLIDDVMTTGQTLKRCAEVIQQAHPKAIYALTLCKTRTSHAP